MKIEAFDYIWNTMIQKCNHSMIYLLLPTEMSPCSMHWIIRCYIKAPFTCSIFPLSQSLQQQVPVCNCFHLVHMLTIHFGLHLANTNVDQIYGLHNKTRLQLNYCTFCINSQWCGDFFSVISVIKISLPGSISAVLPCMYVLGLCLWDCLRTV